MMTRCNPHDAMMNARSKKTNHTTNLGNHGRHLKLRSWGITTLHHYERISSRDLEWHLRENGREIEEVKLSCFFDKRVKPNNLERLSHLPEKSKMKKIKVENTPSEKRNKEEQIRTTLRLKRDARLDKAKRT